MSEDLVTLAVEDGVGIVTLNRPGRANSMNRAGWDALRAAFRTADREPKVRCVALFGTGRNFCAGIDLDMLQNLGAEMGADQSCPARAREKVRDFILDMQDVVNSIEQCRKPVIAAIQGACIGAGVDVVTAADFRYCTADARFSVKEVDMAIIADMGVLQRLPKIVGDPVARELAYTAREVGGEEAKAIGLVNRVFETADAMQAAALETAKTIAAKSPVAMRGVKEVMLHARDHPTAESLRHLALLNAAVMISEDFAETMAALKAKRPPVYSD
jgi:enoyl-CoA hydratase